MNRFLLQIASLREVTQSTIEGSRPAIAQALIKDQTQSLITAFLDQETLISKEGRKSQVEVARFNRLTGLVREMLSGYDKLPDEQLKLMSWLSPVLSSCIHTSNESLRIAIQKLVKRVH